MEIQLLEDQGLPASVDVSGLVSSLPLDFSHQRMSKNKRNLGRGKFQIHGHVNISNDFFFLEC